MSFSDFSSIVSLVASVMTILGIGGFFSWSLYDKSHEPDLAGQTIAIFAYAVKFGLCLALLLLLLIPAVFLHMFLVVVLGDGGIGSSSFYWASDEWHAYVVSYILGILFWTPLYFLSTACIFSWSTTPFHVFYKKMCGEQLEN
ncbi:hypothetical protein V4V60_004002 [Vibrio mimicus]